MCLTLCNPMDCSLPGSSVHGILQARILECVAMPFSRGSSWPWGQTWIFYIAVRFFTIWATSEAQICWRCLKIYILKVIFIRVLLFARNYSKYVDTLEIKISQIEDPIIQISYWRHLDLHKLITFLSAINMFQRLNSNFSLSNFQKWCPKYDTIILFWKLLSRGN